MLTQDGPVYIDINPRLVGQGNAWHAGWPSSPPSSTSPAARTRPPATGTDWGHDPQAAVAVLGAAQHEHTRRAVLIELVTAARHRASYHNSAEELTPLRHDLRTAIPVAIAAAATLAHPAAWRWFSSGAVSNYALAPAGWHEILSGDGA